jgi:DNA repair exonuclease SbcCD ATPase subunit
VKIERVAARAFGPFVGETLELADGLNLIWGPNEAGKSSWHAALYFGLCGRKRGAGQPSREDRDLRARHEPWDGGRWAVGTTICLADGRHIELRHDLGGLTNCYAVDLGLGGRDCSGEIIVGNDTPDGARWLGLDRRTFLTVACVRQGDLLSVRANGRLLQDHLQRGAATGGADESAAAALDRIAQYRRDHVGAAHRAAVGPLRQATVAVENARADLETARNEHAEFCWMLTRQHELDDAELSARGVLYRTEVARAKVESSPPARALQERADEARRQVEEASARRPSQRLLLLAVIAAIAGLTWAWFDQLLVGISLLLIAGGLALLGVTRRDQQAIAEALEALHQAEANVAADREARIHAAHEAHTNALRGYEASARVAAELRAQISERTRGLASVPAAEEALAAAEADLARIEALERTLQLTQSFLMDAQERVHRSVAPILGQQVSRWLPRVTGGRYAEALVDPATLAVGVRARGGPWREASLLSHGTSEQVYLLLRVALVDHLTRAGEVCPLILDEPTSHIDAERTEAVLDLLLEIAQDRQVIVFSQESEALYWAERRLRGPHHKLVRLARPVAMR